MLGEGESGVGDDETKKRGRRKRKKREKQAVGLKRSCVRRVGLETRERVLFLQWLGACGEVFERERGDGSARSPLIVLRAGRAAASHKRSRRVEKWKGSSSSKQAEERGVCREQGGALAQWRHPDRV